VWDRRWMNGWMDGKSEGRMDEAASGGRAGGDTNVTLTTRPARAWNDLEGRRTRHADTAGCR